MSSRSSRKTNEKNFGDIEIIENITKTFKQQRNIYLSFFFLRFKCSFVNCNNMTTENNHNPYCLLLIDDLLL